MRIFSRTIVLGSLLCASLTLHAQWTSSSGITSTSDKVGIGTTAPDEELHVFGNFDGAVVIHAHQASTTGSIPNAIFRATADASDVQLKTNGSSRTLVRFSVPIGGWSELASNLGNGLIVGTVNDKPLIFGTTALRRMTITPTGDVGIGVDAPAKKFHVAGDAQFDGTVTGTFIKAHYQDVAEWVPSKNDLAPGTVVVLDESIGNSVIASAKPYDTMVAGVVSEQPGIILGVEGASKEQIATTGRVRVKVDASAGAIRVGDLLVTSNESGYAMRSTPVDVSGVAMHRPGTIIGKALEPLAGGKGEILVLLSLQ